MAMSKESVQGSDEVDEMYCESCKTKGRSQPAEGFCADCCYYLCSQCLGCHSFLLPNHVQKDKFSMPQDFSLKPCAEHIDEILKFYCQSCKQFFCFRCKEKNHTKCRNVSHLPSFVQTLELKEKARATSKVLEKTLDSVITRERMVDDNIKSVDVLATKAKSEIDRQAQTMKDSIDASCLKLKQEVSTVESDDKAKLTLEKTQLNTLKSKVTSLKSDINNKDKTGERCELFMSITTAEEMLTKDRVSRIPKTDVTEYKFEPATNLLGILRDQSLGHIKKSLIKDGGWRFEGRTFPTISESVNNQYQCREPVTNKSGTMLSNPICSESWEINNDDLALETSIGNGNFGEVFKGVYKKTNEVVAVKTCKDTLPEEDRNRFLLEGGTLKQYDHPNVAKFIGIAAQRQPLMIVMEYVSGGSLLLFLRKENKKRSRLNRAQMCLGAACGMAYLSDKGCIHRDLGARTCLVGDGHVVKISNFFMSREGKEYTVTDGMKLIPVKWTAPEALNYGKYTTACDVWSYGILMWEIFSNGQTPYTGWTNAIAREAVEQGYRMPAPAHTPDSIYQLMLKCWDINPETRITFSEIHRQLSAIVSNPPKGDN